MGFDCCHSRLPSEPPVTGHDESAIRIHFLAELIQVYANCFKTYKN